MFGLYKKRKESVAKLRDWSFDAGSGFKLINNGDSVQYVNGDESIIIYFSVLTVKGKPILEGNGIYGAPTLKQDDYGWQFKGVKKGNNQLLVCAISFKNESDTKWVRDFFDSVNYQK